jgi:hypothetical protein
MLFEDFAGTQKEAVAGLRQMSAAARHPSWVNRVWKKIWSNCLKSA